MMHHTSQSQIRNNLRGTGY